MALIIIRDGNAGRPTIRIQALGFGKSNFRKAATSAKRPCLYLRKSFLAFGSGGK
jgi:hypothetical protein